MVRRSTWTHRGRGWHRINNGAIGRERRRDRGSRRYRSRSGSRKGLGREKNRCGGWLLWSGYNPITRFHGSDFLPRNLVVPDSTEGLKQLVTRNLHFRDIHVNKHRGDGG